MIVTDFTDEEKIKRFKQMQEFALKWHQAKVSKRRFKDGTNYAAETLLSNCLALDPDRDRDFWDYWNNLNDDDDD